MPGRLLGPDVGFSGWWPLGGCWFELPGDRRFVGLWLGSVEAGACLSPRPGQAPPSCLLPPAPHSVEVLHHWLGAFSDAGNSAGPITDLVGDWWVGRDPAHVFSTGWGRSPLWPPLAEMPWPVLYGWLPFLSPPPTLLFIAAHSAPASHRRPRSALFALFAALLLLLSACKIRMDVGVDVNEDGSGSLSVTQAFDEEFRELLEENSGEPVDFTDPETLKEMGLGIAVEDLPAGVNAEVRP